MLRAEVSTPKGLDAVIRKWNAYHFKDYMENRDLERFAVDAAYLVGSRRIDGFEIILRAMRAGVALTPVFVQAIRYRCHPKSLRAEDWEKWLNKIKKSGAGQMPDLLPLEEVLRIYTKLLRFVQVTSYVRLLARG